MDTSGGTPKVEREKCSGCGRCVAACKVKMYTLEVSGNRKHAVMREADRCLLCHACLRECLHRAITS